MKMSFTIDIASYCLVSNYSFYWFLTTPTGLTPSGGGGGTRIWKWRVCACLRTEGHSVQDFVGKGGHWCGIQKIGPCLAWTFQNRGSFRVNFVKFEWKFVFFSWKLTRILKCTRRARKIWNFTVKFWKNVVIGCGPSKKRGHWV